MIAAVQAYVDAYNSLQTTIGNQTKYTAVDQGSTSQDSSNGDLIGDGTLRNIQTSLRSAIHQCPERWQHFTAVTDRHRREWQADRRQHQTEQSAG